MLECYIIKYYVFGNALAVGPVVRKGAALAPTVRASKLSRAGFHPWSGNLDPAAAAAAKSLQSCSALCDPIDGSPWGSPVPGILQARTLEWVAISFSNAWKWKVKVKSLSRIRLFATPWTAAYQAPPSMGFSRQEYWSGLPLPSPLDPASPAKTTKLQQPNKTLFVDIKKKMQLSVPYATCPSKAAGSEH